MQEKVAFIQEEVVLDRFKTLDQLAVVENQLQQLLRAPFECALDRLEKVELRVETGFIVIVLVFFHLLIVIA